MDMAMNNELAMLHQKVKTLQTENEQLRKELETAKKSLAKKNIKELKKMM